MQQGNRSGGQSSGVDETREQARPAGGNHATVVHASIVQAGADSVMITRSRSRSSGAVVFDPGGVLIDGGPCDVIELGTRVRKEGTRGERVGATSSHTTAPGRRWSTARSASMRSGEHTRDDRGSRRKCPCLLPRGPSRIKRVRYSYVPHAQKHREPNGPYI